MCDAFQANQLPLSPVPLLELGVHARKPDIRELKQVRDLHHLARCVEHMYYHADRGTLHSWDTPSGLSDGERHRMVSRFHCAMYRVLFAGAILTREYLEPLFFAPIQGPPGFLHRFFTSMRGQETHELNGLTQKDMEYLERFPVYDLEAGQEKWEPAFGDLASWLLDDIEATFTNVEPAKRPRLGMGAEELGRLQEVAFFLAAYDHIMDKLFNEFHPSTGGDEDVSISDMIPPPFPGRVRKVSIAMFGVFRPEEVSTPERVEDSSTCYLVNEPLVREEQQTPTSQDDCLSPWTADTRWVLEILHKQSGRPNLRNGLPSPPPALRFIEFVLAKFFKVRFVDGVFDEDTRHGRTETYEYGFLEDLNLFRDRSIILTRSWLFAEDRAPSLGYCRLHW